MLPKRVIGILTWREGERFEEPDYLRKLVQTGQELGAVVYLFSHQDVHVQDKKIKGFLPKPNGRWVSKWFPWPEVVIDRYRRRVREYIRLRNSDLFFFANSPFSKKWRVTKLLASDERVKRWIPETHVYAQGMVRSMLARHALVYVKPGNGTGGRSILRVEKRGKEYCLSGRDKKHAHHTARLDTAVGVEKWVKRWVEEQQIRDGNFLVQQGLELGLLRKHVVDVRLLIQKDECGEWSVTGCGVRIGENGSATSNLHGGGRAIPFEWFLSKRFGVEQAESIKSECYQLAYEVAKTLEDYFGRMMEFGLDIGVDVQGRAWLIEVNPKPGREVFRQMGDMQLYKMAIARPVQFALYLAKNQARFLSL
ncbi:YheC/YheD family protein [Brevibacillus sp. 179-C 1.1 NHS]|uniref:YheC/YheD family endospore coat-associated protein n=1 Tax=Brevibacillus sp. 179-C 1.1 NHS TaxID=3235177 RepID=UPI0039A361CC